MIDFDKADKIYLGTTEIDKLYKGTEVVYTKQTPPIGEQTLELDAETRTIYLLPGTYEYFSWETGQIEQVEVTEKKRAEAWSLNRFTEYNTITDFKLSVTNSDNNEVILYDQDIVDGNSIAHTIGSDVGTKIKQMTVAGTFTTPITGSFLFTINDALNGVVLTPQSKTGTATLKTYREDGSLIVSKSGILTGTLYTSDEANYAMQMYGGTPTNYARRIIIGHSGNTNEIKRFEFTWTFTSRSVSSSTEYAMTISSPPQTDIRKAGIIPVYLQYENYGEDEFFMLENENRYGIRSVGRVIFNTPYQSFPDDVLPPED